MGCENSKTVRVLPASLSRDNSRMVEGKEGATQTPDLNIKRRQQNRASTKQPEYSLDQHGNKVKKKSHKNGNGTGTCQSLEDTRSMDSERGCSATSKQSADSGLGDDYAHVITEYSAEGMVMEVERAFKPRGDLELSVTGVQCGTRNSARDKARLEEAHIMQTLREEGLITKPAAQAAGGMCFEIVDAIGDGRPKPPPRLEKLAMERSKKKKRTLTEDEIRDKLERAERRRKKREQERLEKLRVMERTDAVAALENFAQYQKSKEETINQRMDQVQDNRDRKLREVKEKQERRKKHAEEVRRRKSLAKENGQVISDDYDPDGTPGSGGGDRNAASHVHGVPLQVKESKERCDSRGSSRSRD